MNEAYEDLLYSEIRALEALLSEIDPDWRKHPAHWRAGVHPLNSLQESLSVSIRAAKAMLRAAYGLAPEQTEEV